MQKQVRVLLSRDFEAVQINGAQGYRPLPDSTPELFAELLCETAAAGRVKLPALRFPESPVDEAGGPAFVLFYVERGPEGWKYMATGFMHRPADSDEPPRFCLYRDDFAAGALPETVN